MPHCAKGERLMNHTWNHYLNKDGISSRPLYDTLIGLDPRLTEVMNISGRPSRHPKKKKKTYAKKQVSVITIYVNDPVNNKYFSVILNHLKFVSGLEAVLHTARNT